MKIKWLGHSCFLITSDSGVRILTDPFHEKVGYAPPAVEVDIVSVSHGHYDHCFTDAIKGSFSLLNKEGLFNEHGVSITGIHTYHDDEMGAKRGENIIFIFEIDGLRICHCGDLGHLLNDDEINHIGHIDIMMIPVGGIYTIDSRGAYEVVNQIKPVVTIPMHFKTAALSFPLGEVDGFLSIMGAGTSEIKHEIKVTKENIHEYTPVAVMDYK